MKMDMTVGEQKHMAVTEHQLRRIADALEKIAGRLEKKADRPEPDKVAHEEDTKIDHKMERIIENAVEIASGCLPALQENKDSTNPILGRDGLIRQYIIPWAVDAEKEYQNAIAGGEEVPYYDFIDDFAAKEFEKETGRKLEDN